MANNEKKQKTIAERQKGKKAAVIEHLKAMPILKIALDRAGISHATFYVWRENDPAFKTATDIAFAEGEALINDLSESQLIQLIKEKNFPAIHLWLRSHHKKYSTKVEVMATVKETKTVELSPEQKTLIEEALRLAALPVPEIPREEHDQSVG